MRKLCCSLLVALMITSTLSFSYATSSRQFVNENELEITPLFKSSEWYNKSTKAFSYPIVPGSTEWENFNTHDEMIEACTIPSAILENISTNDLAELVLDYPLLSDYIYFSSIDLGLNTLILNFNGMKELLDRPDGVSTLIQKYKDLKVEDTELPSSIESTSDEMFASSLKKFEKEDNTNYKTFMTNCNNNLKIKFVEDFMSTFDSKLSINEKTDFNKALLLKQYPDKVVDSRSIPKASIVIKTPSGKVVPSSSYYYDRTELTTNEKNEIKSSVISRYPKATILRNPTNKYNCHSYAWYSQSTTNKIWLNSCLTYKLDSKSYTGTLFVQANNKVVYGGDLHSGIVYNTNGDSTGYTSKIRSKWGSGPLMEHSILYTPSSYGASVAFFKRV